MTQKERQQLVNEVNILRDLDNEQIVRQKDRIIDKNKQMIQIVMEFCEHGDISKLVKQCRKSSEFVAEEVVWKVLYQLLVALNQIHSKKILHRDLKPGNLFIDGQKNIKLGDFGLSRALGAESVYAQTNVGTPYYMSPEVCDGKAQDFKSDIWSAGCLVYELANLRPPFQADTQWNLGLKIKEGKFARLPLRYSEELMEVINGMLRNNPDSRLSAHDILQNKTLQIRGQDQQLRQSQAVSKQKNDKLLADIMEIDQKTKEVTRWAAESRPDPNLERSLDSQIDELKYRMQQLKSKTSHDINRKRPGTANYNENHNIKKNQSLRKDENDNPLKSIEINSEIKAHQIRKSLNNIPGFKTKSLLDF